MSNNLIFAKSGADDLSLRVSELRYRRLFETARDGILLLNAQNRKITDANPFMTELLGYSHDDLLGKELWEIGLLQDKDASLRAFEQLEREEYIRYEDLPLKNRNGQQRDVEFVSNLYPEGDHTVIQCNIRDITERKRAGVVLHENEERLRLVVEAGHIGTCDWNYQTDEMQWNAPHFHLYGMEMQNRLMHFGDFLATVHPEDREYVERSVRGGIESCNEHSEEYRIIHADGSIRWLVETGRVVAWDEEGKPLRVISVFFDITDRKQTEEALEIRVGERTVELAEMGQMRQELLRQLVNAQEEERAAISRDLHDDTGQQITAMLLGLESLKQAPGFATDAKTQATLAQVQALAQDVAKKAHRLSFTLRPTALDDLGLLGALHNYIEEWSQWSSLPVDLQGVGMGEASKNRVRLPPEVETTIYRITQEALTNILRHASIVSQGAAPALPATQVNLLIQRQAREVVATIEDDGPGFDVEAALNLPPGQRRLGLFGMQERARLAGGTLTIESNPGEGTTIFLRLPLPAL